MFTDFEYADKRLSDFGWVVGHIDSNSGIAEVDIGCDITFNTVKNNHSSIHYVSSTSYDNVCTPPSFDIFKDPCEKNQEDMYVTNDEVSVLTKWLNRHGYRKFKPLYHSDESDIHYYGSFNVKKKTINDRVVGLVLTFNSNAPYGFGEQIINEVNMENNEVTVSGEFIHVTDCATASVINIGMQGNTEQPTTNGYQLFDANRIPTKSSGGASVTNNGNGSFTISGSGVSTGSLINTTDLTHEETIALLKVGTLHFDYKAVTNPYIYAQLITSEAVYFEIGNYTKESSTIAITQKMLDDEEVYLRLGFYMAAETEIVTATIKPMLYQDGDGTFEMFTGGQASPNMTYNQKIAHKGTYNEETGKYEVKQTFCKKNLWDSVYAGNSSNWKTRTGKVENSGYHDLPIRVGIGNKVTISYTQPLSTGINLYMGVALTEKENISTSEGWMYHSAASGLIRNSITLTASEECICIRYHGALDDFMQYIGNDLQIEIATEKSDYEKHQSQTITITSDRPVTKWDTLIEKDGQIGWGYRGIKVVVDGSLSMQVYDVNGIYSGFTMFNALPKKMNRRDGYCNQLTVDTVGMPTPDGLWIGVDDSLAIYAINNSLFDNTLEDYGLANFKAHLNENPLEIWTYTDEVEFVPLPKEEQETIRNIMMYSSITNISNNQGMNMEVTYLQDYDNQFVICGDSDEYITTLYPNITITCKRDGDLRIKNTLTGNVFEVLNCSEGETIYINGEHKFINSDNENHKNTTLFNDFNYNFLDINVSEDDFSENIYETSIPCKIVIDYSPIRKVGV